MMTTPQVVAIEHVQLAMPEGGEDEARAFWCVLGFVEVPKPDVLAGRGGVWMKSGSVRVHMGVETPFSPAKKAHPALVVTCLATAVAALEAAGGSTTAGEALPGFIRAFTHDPFGNRIELMERQ